MPERYRVSASAIRLRRLLAVTIGPFIGALQVVRLYTGNAFDRVGAGYWLALIAVVIFVTAVATYGARGWIRWAAQHYLEVTGDGLLLVDGEDKEFRSFSDVARLDVREIAGKISRARLTYAGGLKQDLSFYERLSELVLLLQTHLPPDRVHGRFFSRRAGTSNNRWRGP